MNKRKQKLEIKPDLISAEKDSLMDYDVTSDLFSSSPDSDLDIPSNVICDDDFLNLLDLPFSFEDEPLSHESKEVFQDLICTSTPKSSSRPSVSKVFYDSGIDGSDVKKIKKENGCSYHILEDITSKINSISNNNFVNISHLSDSKSSDTSDDNTSFKKHVNILRKDFILQTKIKNANDSSITKEQMIYYTGIKSYDVAIAILKHIKMPKCEVSSFKMELMSLMKLRLDLPWLDMSFRFSIPETTLKEIVKKSFHVMSYSLEDLLPWHSPRKVSRRTVFRTYYVYSLISGQSSHILIVLTDSKRPVLFVSEHFNSKVSAISFILNRCSTHLIPGDVLCVTDVTGMNLFYTVSNSDIAFLVSSPSPNHYSVVDKCHLIMVELLSDFTFLSKENDFIDTCKLAKVAGAIINLNSVSEVSSFQLQKIYEKSSRIML